MPPDHIIINKGLVTSYKRQIVIDSDEQTRIKHSQTILNTNIIIEKENSYSNVELSQLGIPLL